MVFGPFRSEKGKNFAHFGLDCEQALYAACTFTQANHFGGAQSKGLATRRNVSKLTFLEQDWASKVCRLSVLFSLPTWETRFYSAI